MFRCPECNGEIKAFVRLYRDERRSSTIAHTLMSKSRDPFTIDIDLEWYSDLFEDGKDPLFLYAVCTTCGTKFESIGKTINDFCKEHMYLWRVE